MGEVIKFSTLSGRGRKKESDTPPRSLVLQLSGEDVQLLRDTMHTLKTEEPEYSMEDCAKILLRLGCESMLKNWAKISANREER